MNKKKLFFTCGFVCASSLVVGIAATNFGKMPLNFGLATDELTTMSLVDLLAGKVAEDGVVSFVKDGYTFYFATNGVTFNSGAMVFAADGYLRNITAYNGMDSVDLVNDCEMVLGLGTGNATKVVKTGENVEADSDSYSAQGSTHFSLKAYEETEVTKLDLNFQCRYDGIITTTETKFNYTWNLEGTGSELNPYLIQSYDDWAVIAKESADGDVFSGVHFKLMFSPTFSNADKGQYAFTNFAGNFDGNNKTVTLQDWVFSSEAERGLFYKTTNGANIKDLTLKGKITAKNRVGALVGLMEGSTNISGLINYCTVIGTVNADSVGGFVGRIQNGKSITFTATDCVNHADVTAKGNRVGGIVGGDLGDSSTYTRCTNNGAVKSEESSSVAGIVGLRGSNNASFTLIDCVNNGDISVGTSYDSNVGAAGIAAAIGTDSEAIEIHIKGCINNGKVFGGKSTKTTSFGGIVSSIKYNSATSKKVLIEDCKNYGVIEANGYENGGIIGSKYCMHETTIKNCENHAEVKGYGQVGGIVGRSINAKGAVVSILSCLNDAKVSTTNDKRAGGIAGNIFEKTLTISDCVNLGEVVSAKDTVGGIVGAQGTYTSGGTGHTFVIKNCVNGSATDPTKGYVHSNTGDTLGGILGYSDGGVESVTFENNSNYGQVGDGIDHSSAGKKAGGLIGYFPKRDLTITGCVSLGDVYCNTTLATTDLGCLEETAINVPGIYVGVYTTGKTITIVA